MTSLFATNALANLVLNEEDKRLKSDKNFDFYVHLLNLSKIDQAIGLDHTIPGIKKTGEKNKTNDINIQA